MITPNRLFIYIPASSMFQGGCAVSARVVELVKRKTKKTTHSCQNFFPKTFCACDSGMHLLRRLAWGGTWEGDARVKDRMLQPQGSLIVCALWKMSNTREKGTGQTCKGGLLHLCQTAVGLKQGMLRAKIIPVFSWGGGGRDHCFACTHRRGGH